MRGRVGALVLACLCAVPAYAQYKASIQGTVTDPSGALVPGAAVVAINQETGRRWETVASEQGLYRVSGLPPGRYTLSVEAPGFKRKEIQDLVVHAEETTGANVLLELGAVQETITVAAEEIPVIQTENANVTKAITSEQVLRLQQFGRDPYELARLAPGVLGDAARSSTGGAISLPNVTGPGGSNLSVFQTENQVQISANGQRVSANNFLVDGVSVNSLGWGGTAVVTPNLESVKEVRVLSTSYSAEDGRNSGAQVKVVTKSGTNDFHGTAFIRYADPGMNSRNKYGGFSNAPRTRVEQQFRQFGGSFGGPILRERLFLFFSYEGMRRSFTDFQNKFVETPEYRNAVISNRAGGVTAAILGEAGVEPRIVSIIPTTCAGFSNCQVVSGGLDLGSLAGGLGSYVDSFPPIGNGGGFDGIADLIFVQLATPSRFRGDQFNTRIDFTRGNDQFAVSTFFVPQKSTNADLASQARPMADISSERLNWAATLLWNRAVSVTMLNEARLNYTRWSFDELNSNPDVNFGVPRVEVEGFLPAGERLRFGAPRSETTPGVFAQNTFEFRDTISKVWRNHGFKFGGESRWEQDNNNLLGGARPVYSFVGPWNFANDAPIFEGINTDPPTGRPADAQFYLRTRTYGFFVQDDWKIRPNLTLNLGLRYEYFTPAKERRGRLANIVQAADGSISRVEPVGDLFQGDKNNWAPRLGFAWTPGRFAERLVVRGGFGLHYNRIPNVLVYNARGNPPFFARHGICCGTAGDPFAGGRIFYTLGASSDPKSYPANPALALGVDPASNGIIGNSVEVYATGPETPNAYVYTQSFELEYAFPGHVVASLGYQGSSSHKLVRIVNHNFLVDASLSADCNPDPAAFQPCFNPVFFIRPDVNANYNALNLRIERRFVQGFQVSGIYTWSKSIDTLSFEGPGAETNQTNPADLRSERGPSDYDAGHRVIISGLWDLPIFRNRTDWWGKLAGGWQINGILTGHTGFPWTPKQDNCLILFGQFLCPVRPAAQLQEPLRNSGDEAFTQPPGNFPNGCSDPTNTCGDLYFQPHAGFPAGPPGVGRNILRGPTFMNIDLSLVKRFGLPNTSFWGEGAGVEIRADFFNAFNFLNLEPFRFFSPGVFINRPNFGLAERGGAGRVVTLQARFSF